MRTDLPDGFHQAVPEIYGSFIRNEEGATVPAPQSRDLISHWSQRGSVTGDRYAMLSL